MTDTIDRGLIGIKAAALEAGVGAEQIRNLIRRGVLKTPDFAKTWRQKPILIESFNDWLENRKGPGAPKQFVKVRISDLPEDFKGKIG